MSWNGEELKQYSAVVSYVDECCDRPHIMVEKILAASSRQALRIAVRRTRKHRVTTGDIKIVRGQMAITGTHIEKSGNFPQRYLQDEDPNTKWTAEETNNKEFTAG